MTELTENPHSEQKAEAEPISDPPISVRQILKENWVLARALIFFFLMLSVPLLIAWKFNLFLVANN